MLADDDTVVVKCATTENGIYTANVFHCAAGTMLMEHTPVQSCIQYVHVHDIVLYNHVLQYKSEGRNHARN